MSTERDRERAAIAYEEKIRTALQAQLGSKWFYAGGPHPDSVRQCVVADEVGRANAALEAMKRDATSHALECVRAFLNAGLVAMPPTAEKVRIGYIGYGADPVNAGQLISCGMFRSRKAAEHAVAARGMELVEIREIHYMEV